MTTRLSNYSMNSILKLFETLLSNVCVKLLTSNIVICLKCVMFLTEYSKTLSFLSPTEGSLAQISQKIYRAIFLYHFSKFTNCKTSNLTENKIQMLGEKRPSLIEKVRYVRKFQSLIAHNSSALERNRLLILFWQITAWIQHLFEVCSTPDSWLSVVLGLCICLVLTELQT